MEKFEILSEQQCALVYGATGSFWMKVLKFILKFGDALLEGILEGWKDAEKDNQTSLTF